MLPFEHINQSFHRRYQEGLDAELAQLGSCSGRPVVICYSDKLEFLWEGGRLQAPLRRDAFHLLKACAHARMAVLLGESEEPLASWIEAALVGQPAPLAEQCRSAWRGQDWPGLFAAAARSELEDLHERFWPWWSQLSRSQQQSCAAVVFSPHQARAGRLSADYFAHLWGCRLGVGAQGEERLIIIESEELEENALKALARHFLDRRLSVQIGLPPERLQRDLLADGSAAVIAELQAGAGGNEWA